MQQHALFKLDVFVRSVERLDGACEPGAAVACRFLDYPVFFIHPRAASHCKVAVFDNGKSCLLSETAERLRAMAAEVWSACTRVVRTARPGLFVFLII